MPLVNRKNDNFSLVVWYNGNSSKCKQEYDGRKTKNRDFLSDGGVVVSERVKHWN